MVKTNKFDLYPGNIQTIIISTDAGLEETARQVREWVIGYGYRPAQIPDMESGIWQRVVGNKRRAFDQLTELGIRRENIKHSVAQCVRPGGTYSVRLSARLDWPRGDFGDDGSCLYGSYSANMDAMRHLGTLVLQFFDQYGNGIGRLWVGVYPPAEGCSLNYSKEDCGHEEQDILEQDVQWGFLVFGAYGKVANLENQTYPKPTAILGALLLSEITGVKLWSGTMPDDGVWLGGKPTLKMKSSYTLFEGMDRPRSGYCATCSMQVHALDSRWPRLGDLREFQCMDCMINDKFEGVFAE